MDLKTYLRLPGFGSSVPAAPAPLPPLPEREDPAVLEAREKLRLSEKRRKGRRASILTGGAGLDDDLGIISRPSAGGIYAGDRGFETAVGMSSISSKGLGG